jgi:hypothetical protein
MTELQTESREDDGATSDGQTQEPPTKKDSDAIRRGGAR